GGVEFNAVKMLGIQGEKVFLFCPHGVDLPYPVLAPPFGTTYKQLSLPVSGLVVQYPRRSFAVGWKSKVYSVEILIVDFSEVHTTNIAERGGSALLAKPHIDKFHPRSAVGGKFAYLMPRFCVRIQDDGIAHFARVALYI